MLAFGFTLNLLTLLAIVLSVGLVVDDAIVVVENVERHLHEGEPPLHRRAARRARTGRPDHRHDHHARGGLCAHRHPGRPHRHALPRVCLHPRRRGRRLRRGRAHALADDVLASSCARAIRTRALPAGSIAVSTASAAATCACSTASLRWRPGHAHPGRHRHPARHSLLPLHAAANSRRRKTRASSSASSTPRRIPPSSRPRATPKR